LEGVGVTQRARRHFLEQSLLDGLRSLDVPELLKLQIEHNSAEGEWERGVISPSLVGISCRLARLKKFLGHDPQPGLKHMGVRQGFPDPNSKINMLRGFNFEGIVVAALRHVLSSAVVGAAPTLLFRWRYQGEDGPLSNWRSPLGPLAQMVPEIIASQPRGMVFAGHPDVLIQDPDHDHALSLIQVKCPRIAKCERIKRLGPSDALETYRAQMVTEMYIGRAMGWPIERSYLLIGTMEGNFTGAKSQDPYLDVIELPWHESMRLIPEEVARELAQDAEAAREGQWPAAYPESAWDAYPCSYCNYSRLGNFETIGCTEPQQWEQHARHGTTRLTQPLPDERPGTVVRTRKRPA
jgi:hypothetical protein